MRKIQDKLWHFLYPDKCLLCRKILDDDELDLCHNCRIDMPECPPNGKKLTFIDSWAAVWYYDGKARSSLLRYKFQGARSYAQGYGRLLAMKLMQTHPEGFDLITWVPVSSLRKFSRGFDQVELLANAVGQELGMEPVRLLKKIRHNRRQSRIKGDAQRRANVLGVYRAEQAQLLSGKRILLLDDIITSGATVGECARILLTAGAKEVHCGAVTISRPKAKHKVR